MTNYPFFTSLADPITIYVNVYDTCVWTYSQLNMVAAYCEKNFKRIHITFTSGHLDPMFVPFVNFYKRLATITELLQVENPEFLRHCMDMEIEHKSNPTTIPKAF
ncbi:unnamed protein product [Bursaphelenchus okinawaensis]|uniref:Uncharacterized protein n=1 Tax=Bursaphelenchus okinawaensis TaxID=465554 RepID=A0A811LNR1_9BILA|nr:unnamed protein product [Bursaphelenchus okinawaensis]CAG9124920.1 unnamed protein product [Bursaphelenchus okinawaensis]